MRRFSGKLSILVAAVAICLSWGKTQALAADTFHEGDPFVVAQQGAPLMRGTSVLATLSQGQRLNVLRTQGDWVGTSAVVGGRPVGGWVHRSHVATPAQYAQRRTTRRRYSYQSGAAEGGYSYPSYGYSGRSQSGSVLNRRLIMGYTPYGPSYWRADRKIMGY